MAFRRVVATLPDRTVAGFGAVWWDPSLQPGHLFVRVRVDSPFLGRGIGKTIFNDLRPTALELGGSFLKETLPDSDAAALAWACSLGFTAEGHCHRYSLTLREWDPDMWMPTVHALKATGSSSSS